MVLHQQRNACDLFYEGADGEIQIWGRNEGCKLVLKCRRTGECEGTFTLVSGSLFSDSEFATLLTL